MNDKPATIDDVWKERREKRKTSSGIQAYDAWKTDPSPANMHSVVKELDPAISSAVSAYVGQKASPTIKHRARILAAQAIKTYDPQYGATLPTHVNRQLQALQRMAPSLVDPLPAPEKFRQNSQAIATSVGSLEELLGREPTDEEVAENTGLPIKRVIKVRSNQRGRVPMSMLEADDDDEGGNDIVTNSREPYEDWADAVYHDLGDTDRLIFMHRSGYRGAPRLQVQQIAEKLGVSPAYVSQRARRIQERLDEFDG
jgi:DNA-directed RNA polymerase specialized sigma subunit